MNTPKKKLFTPKGLSDDSDNRYAQWNKEQPIIDGKRINQYDYEGNKQGYWEEYWDNGKLMSKGNYVDDRKVGYWENYFEDGILKFKRIHKDGQYNGIFERYWSNGNLRCKGIYKNGVKNGVWRQYLKDGDMWEHGKYKDGEKIKNLPLTESEQPKKKLFTPKGLSNDENNRYIKLNQEQLIKIINGKEVRINQYDSEGREQGYWEFYYRDGSLNAKGTFFNGKADGYWEYYYDNGNLFRKGNYVNGNMNGYWEYYFLNGNIQLKGNYVNDEKDGVYEYYDRNGEIYSKEYYKNGKKVENIGESEQPKKKKLFVPRNIDERLVDWNNMQPIIDGERINQYDLKTGEPTGRWGEGDINGGNTINLFATYWDVFGDGDFWGEGDGEYSAKNDVFKYMVKEIQETFADDLSEYGPLGNMYFDLTMSLYDQKVKDEFEFLYNENLKWFKSLTESEQPKKKKLFTPKGLSDDSDNRFLKLNKEQPIKTIDGKEIRINQYDLDGNAHGYWEYYNDDGSIMYKGSYVNGIKDGYFEEYYPNGQLWYKGSFKNDLKDGYWEYYWDNGDLNLSANYIDGIMNIIKESEQPKKKKLFTPKGLSDDSDNRYLKLNKEQPIKTIDGKEIRINQLDYDGNKIGYWEEYYSDGELKTNGNYINGDKGGYWEYWYKNGNIMFKGDYVNGLKDGYWKRYHSNGKIFSKGNYKNGEYIGKWEFFSDTGVLIKTLTESEQPKKKLFTPKNIDSRYNEWNKEQPIIDGVRINQYDKNGEKDGLWISYDGNGSSKIMWRNGEQNGIYQTFYPSGQIQYDGMTKDGDYHGVWKMYYQNGGLREISNYENDRLVGVKKWFHPNGDLNLIVNYVDGKTDGLSITYNFDGTIHRKDVYSMSKKVAYIVYDDDGNEVESMSWDDSYDDMLIKENIDKKDEILKSWVDYYGSDETAKWELDLYEWEVNDLIKNGGNVYRVLFVDDISEINTDDLGDHWTTSRNNAIDIGETNKFYYGQNKKNIFVVEGYVEPNSITIKGVDIKGNPLEKEVNIKNGSSVKNIKVFRLYAKELIPTNIGEIKKINEEMTDKDEILKSFKPKKELNPKIWDNDDKLKKKIKDTLVAIGEEFYKSLEMEEPIEDIIFTGSLANYNWSQYSDVDLHVIIDFDNFDDKELIKKYFDAKKAIWNDKHNIKIKGYDVELYAQDVNEPHESTGIYSIMKDEWIKKPKYYDISIDKGTIKKKVRQFESDYNRILDISKEGSFDAAKKSLDDLKEKIRKYRKAGLDKGGEMSTENLVFKTLRRSGLMEKISKLGVGITDKQYTIETLGESKKKLFTLEELFNNK